MNPLTSIGSVLEGTEQKDAIHIAVAPVIAGEELLPAQPVGFTTDDRVTVGHVTKPVGIIDPYLTGPVHPGQKIWMFMYPNTITSIRHEWIHPAFVPPVKSKEESSMDKWRAESLLASHKWIEEFAMAMGSSYDILMEGAEQYLERGEYTYDNTERYKNVKWEHWSEFWKHFQLITGKKVDEHDDGFFTCSC